MTEAIVEHISDTALWIASIRARETRRPAPLYRDPLADRLAGPRGHAIADRLGARLRNEWALTVRTRLIDDLVATALAEGADRVLNLAAGLDTRPYRLPLPASLRWIEADLPGVVDTKERLLAGEHASCVLVREKVDLADADARRAFLERALEGAQRALVITEGLLVYLEPEQVRDIARDLRMRDEIAWWMIDLASPAIVDQVRRKAGAELGEGARMKFAPPDGVAFFQSMGWRARDVRSYFREALRLRRAPWWMYLLSFFPDPDPTRLGTRRPWGAIVRFARA